MSAWSISFDPRAERDLQKLSSVDRGRILRFLSERVAPLDDPRSLGKPRKANFTGAWRYRVGDDQLVILVLAVGQRGNVYR